MVVTPTEYEPVFITSALVSGAGAVLDPLSSSESPQPTAFSMSPRASMRSARLRHGRAFSTREDMWTMTIRDIGRIAQESTWRCSKKFIGRQGRDAVDAAGVPRFPAIAGLAPSARPLSEVPILHSPAPHDRIDAHD